jgi:predicted nucleic acid-binding protein
MASTGGRLLYVDASALVKLIQLEPETAALLAGLRDWPEQVTSAIAEIETHRAANRAGVSEAAVDDVLGRVGLIDLDEPVRELARRVGSPALRTLDAIHLASALSLGAELGAFCCYDERLADDAGRAGLLVVAPGR